MNNEKCIIDPNSEKDVSVFCGWVACQGDGRGLVVEEGKEQYLVVFDSYNTTHASMARALGLGYGHGSAIIDALTFLPNGEILSDLDMLDEGLYIYELPYRQPILDFLTQFALKFDSDGRVFAYR